MRKLTLSLAALLVAAGVSGPALADPVTITYTTFSAAPNYITQLEATIAAFEAAHPDIKVNYETQAFDAYFTKLQTTVAAGQAPDAFELNYENFVTYASNGSLAELQNVDSSVYKKTLYDAFNSGGKQYGVPESFSNVVLFYNKTLFKQAGVAEPTADWTWKDEQAAAAKLTNKATKTWGDYQPVSYNEFYKVLAQNGGEFLNADRTEATFNSPQGVEAANFLVGKVGKTMPTEADGAGTPDFDSKLFKSGKLAMWHTGIWMFSALDGAKFDWDVVVEPGNTKKASAMFANGLVVNAASKNAAAAQKWITYLSSSDETTKTRLASSWELPPVADESKLKTYLDQPKPANREAVFTALEEPVLPPVVERQQEMQDAVTQELSSAAAGRKTVEKALADAQSKVNGLLKK